MAARYGLDRDLLTPYGLWLGTALRGDLGVSVISGAAVTTEFALRLPVTAELTLLGVAAALLLGVPLKIRTATPAGVRRGGGAIGRLVSGFGVSVPEFVLGSVVVFLFSRYVLGLPVGGYVPFGENPGANVASMVLPAAVLSVFVIAVAAHHPGRRARRAAGALPSPRRSHAGPTRGRSSCGTCCATRRSRSSPCSARSPPTCSAVR